MKSSCLNSVKSAAWGWLEEWGPSLGKKSESIYILFLKVQCDRNGRLAFFAFFSQWNESARGIN
ncbi:hypothetical protein [Laspinema olomoucense]|uniref:Uncharacterized protein n=1 Tax=Laspinema olomoucense D3b TaxID=2953688 RepID=A0ABT2NEK5_9CYAN|nr:hypothetical protein [Laspinema sp. D3c]MCT7980911.1 hypothetical protein [Laspinema sp. D3b]MCT7995168.1 hypothetical protein [Laspinema sp. D3c]